ncbi:MAG: heavy metal translocating P-type ATPase [Pirellulales bacterium]
MSARADQSPSPPRSAAKASFAAPAGGLDRVSTAITILALAAIALHLLLRFALAAQPDTYNLPLYAALLLGGGPLVFRLARQAVAREFGADLLAGIAIVTAVLLGEYLAGTIVVLMLSGGGALESYAVRSASSVLAALAKRVPSVAHWQRDTGLVDVPLEDVSIGDRLLILPHEICPVDGTVVEGRGVMDESYLTGEPFMMSKTPGTPVFSGAINGSSALTIETTRRAVDSRYARIMQVMQLSQQRRPRIRRLGDQLGAFYTPLALAIALAAWAVSGDSTRFLAVLVVATPCPLLIAIPVAIIGSISLAARRGIIIKDPAVLEQVEQCRTVILDKTGTLTYGRPQLVAQQLAPGFERSRVLSLAASLERYSKHPLSQAIVEGARREGLAPLEASEIREPPGAGLRGTVAGADVRIISRAQLLREGLAREDQLPLAAAGLECCVVVDGRYAATYTLRDEARSEGVPFIGHLAAKHHVNRILLVSGDRESEVRYLADQVGIRDVFASQSPEQKVDIVRRETARAKTLFLGDGINDAPALTAATVGVAFGQNSEITTEAAGAVIMDSTLTRVDEFLHISRRMRSIALQSALGGMALSLVGMGFAAAGWLPPVAGAIAQEVIDVLAVVNALRVAVPPKSLTDF